MENKNTHQEAETKSQIADENDSLYARNLVFVDMAVTNFDHITLEHHGNSFRPPPPLRGLVVRRISLAHR